MLFSSNRGRMQRKADAAQKARRRPGRSPAASSKPAVECLEERALPSLFGPPTTYNTGAEPTGVAVGDITGDGHPDIVSANISSDTVSVLPGKGDGTFLPKTDMLLPLTNEGQ